MLRELLGPDFGRVVDVHTHIRGELPDPSPADLDHMVRLARHYGIGRLVMLGNLTGFLGTPDPPSELVSDVNTYTLGAMAAHPGTIIGFAYLNAANPAGFTADEIDRCVVAGGMKGIKLWIAVKATDARLDPIIARAVELDVPVVHHTWYKAVGAGGAGGEESTPADVAELARRFPKAKIIACHLGGGRERGVLDLARAPNLGYDTSGSQPESEIVEFAVARLGAERILFGSDWPIRDYGAQLGRILGARISPEQKSLILRGNAERLIGLESTEESSE